MPPNTKDRPAHARLLALEVVSAVLHRKQPLDAALEDAHRAQELSDSDRAFMRLLIMVMLRRHGQLHALCNSYLSRPLAPSAKMIELILTQAAAQLLFLGTPPHAAVHSAVELASGFAQGQYKGLVNAVLNRIVRANSTELLAQFAEDLCAPAWFFDALCTAYGRQVTEEIIKAQLQEPALDITVKESPELWAEKLGGVGLPGGSVRLSAAGRIENLEGFAEGAWWVQDAAASLPALLLGNVRGKYVLDLCAAPGGKTAQLACSDAHVTAVDISKKRLLRLEQNFERLGLNAEIVVSKTQSYTPPAPVDAVLLDAPCSATGTLRRQPDVAWLKNPSDIARLVDIQRDMLNASALLVKPGGQMVYCVCSLLPQEGEDQAAWFLNQHPDWKLSPVAASEIGNMQECITGGMLRTLPSHLSTHGGMDGFFAARFVRSA